MFVSCKKNVYVVDLIRDNIISVIAYKKRIKRRIFLLVFRVFIFVQNMHAILYHFKHGIIRAIQASREDTYISAQLHMNCWSKQVLLMRHWNFCGVMPRT